MKRITRMTACLLAAALALGFVLTPAYAASSNETDAARLSAELDQLRDSPQLGQYASGQRAVARSAITALANAKGSQRNHALFIAEQRVALAKAAAKVDADRAELAQLQRKHDQIQLETSQAEAAIARAQLARQRLQYEAAVQRAQMLEEQGAKAGEQTKQAQAEAAQAKKLAAAQARAAALARKQARLAEAATKALQGSSGGGAGSSASAGAAQAASLHLSSNSFASGSGKLTAAGRRQVADFARAHSGRAFVIQPRGSSAGRVLAGRRAVAVEAALEAALGQAGSGKVSIGSVGKIANGAEVEITAEP